MSWHELSPNIQYLEAETVNNVYENALYLANAMDRVVEGVNPVDLQNPNAQYSSPINQIRSILQKVEYDMFMINKGTYYVDTKPIKLVSIYYGEPKTIGKHFTLEDYQRWILILNDLYDIVINGKGIWQALKLNDCIPTINNKPIALRGETIG